MVHKYFCLWHSHAYFCDGGGYCEADYPKKDEKGNKANRHISPISHSRTRLGRHSWHSGRSVVLPSVSWNGTEPNFTVNISRNYLLTIFFCAEAEGWEITFHKNATVKDVDALIGFCSDSLGIYPVRNVGTK